MKILANGANRAHDMDRIIVHEYGSLKTKSNLSQIETTMQRILMPRARFVWGPFMTAILLCRPGLSVFMEYGMAIDFPH